MQSVGRDCDVRDARFELEFDDELPDNSRTVAEGHLLHVEDDEGMARVASLALTAAGFSVRTMTNGIEALRIVMAEPHAFDLIVLNLVLPWINGLDVLAAIRSDASTRHLPVLVTTGTIVTPHEFAGDHLVAVLTKPFDADELVRAVHMTLYNTRFGGTTGRHS